jgi:hypothetical protein
MKLTLSIELFDRFLFVESGRLEESSVIPEESDEESEEIVRLPLGFQAPPDDEKGSDEDEEIECRRGA